MITEKEIAASSVATPAANKKTLFLDSADGEFKTKDESGTVASLQGPQGDPGATGDPGADGADGVGVPAGGTTGQVLKKASGTDFDTAWDDEAGGSGAVEPSICNGRLTLETGVPVSTTDQTAKTTIYFTPFKGNAIALYSGSAWVRKTFSEISLALGTLTSGKNYDVFVYDDAGTVTLEFSAAWTNDTTRADALTLQDGVLVKSGTTTRRYLGTLRTTSTTTTEDSAAKRFVWNAYNQQRRLMKNATETTDSWTYTTATFRQANANAANQLDYVSGDASTLVEVDLAALVNTTIAESSGGNIATVGIGVDSTSVNSAQTYGTNIDRTATKTYAKYAGTPGVGRHFLAWLEYSGATGTTTWFGDAGSPTAYQSAIIGTIWN